MADLTPAPGSVQPVNCSVALVYIARRAGARTSLQIESRLLRTGNEFRIAGLGYGDHLPNRRPGRGPQRNFADARGWLGGGEDGQHVTEHQDTHGL
jgi:hypothetical protein